MARDQGLEQIAAALDVSVRSVRRWVTREGCPSERGPVPRRAYLLNLDEVTLPADAEVYLCGGNGFVQAVRRQLTSRGIPAARVHCELFGPNDWLLD